VGFGGVRFMLVGGVFSHASTLPRTARVGNGWSGEGERVRDARLVELDVQ
jgi:hypothetical protein